MTLQHVLKKYPGIKVHVLEVDAKENLGINKYPLMDLRINAIVKEDERDDYFFLFVFSKILKTNTGRVRSSKNVSSILLCLFFIGANFSFISIY